MRFNDTCWGLLVLFFGGVILFHTRNFPDMPGHQIGPALFPRIIACGLLLCGLVLVWSGRRQGAPWFEADDWVRRPRTILDVALVIGALIFYALVVEVAGFFITGLVILAALFLAFGVPARWLAPLAIGVTLALHFGFYTLLRVPLPWGWLEGMAW